jgi:hypothetical protein
MRITIVSRAVPLLLAATLERSALAQIAVPEELQDWQAWVLDGHEYRRCPLMTGRSAAGEQDFVCAWPGELALSVDVGGATFTQRWQVFAESWVTLPGNMLFWPQEVTLDGDAASLVARDSRPMLRLAPGEHTVAGRMRWRARPETLPMPEGVALIELTLDGTLVEHPMLEGGVLWLGPREAAGEAESLDVQVYRLLTDDVPAFLDTEIRLRASGDAREEVLAAPLPQGFMPLAIESDLTTRLDPDGRLRVQVRAGEWTVHYRARGSGVPAELAVEPGTGVWPNDEIWSFAANDRQRVAAIENVEAVNPEQVDVPEDWLEFPAYRLPVGNTLRVAERSRGLPADNGNDLELTRELWLDFDHGGYVAVDRISGRMQNGWRLDMREPYRLLSARLDEEDNLLVTRGMEAGTTGVELRRPELNLTASARLEPVAGRMAASGWDERFQSVNGVLNLPPGHQLLAVLGAETSPNAWINRWTLLDIFLALVTAVAIGRLVGVLWGVVTGVALVLTFQEPLAASWLWINAVLPLALARFAPEGWLRRIAGWYRNVAFLALVIWLVPFALNQFRLALYPQLETQGFPLGPAAYQAPSLAQAPVADAVREERGQALKSRMRQGAAELESIVVTASKVGAALGRYAPGTQVQTGPGIPNWRYLRYRYAWGGPVAADDEVQFVILGRIEVVAWRVAGAVLAILVLLALLRLAYGWRIRLPGLAPQAALLLALAITPCIPEPAYAAETPDNAILTELHNRLVRPPKCVPTCAELQRAEVITAPSSLSVTLTVNALAGAAVPVPAAQGRWQPDTITVDGSPHGFLFRDERGQHWLDVAAGVHQVRMAGRLRAADSVQLVFPQAPRLIAVSGDGWDASGIEGERLLTNSLELVRRRQAGGSEEIDVSAQLPPFVRVTRSFALGLEWSVETYVERIAPTRGAFTIEIPLIAGESVLTADMTVRNGNMVVAFGALDEAIEWRSALPPSTSIELANGEGVPWTEVWSFAVAELWNARFTGIPAVLPEDADKTWLFEFHPRASETLNLAVTRPEPSPGNTLAIDSAFLESTIGRRAGSHTLRFSYRSTQGGRHVVTLPADARVTSVSVDDRNVTVRPEQGQLPLALLPGEHRVQIAWETDQGIRSRERSPAVDLGASASNIRMGLRLPDSRWLLFASGGGVAPAVLYWGELVVFVVIAIFAGRLAASPLHTYEWLLLGLGLSTFAWLTLALFALWAFAMRWRERWHGDVSVWRYRLVQIGLAILTVWALGGLIAAIPNGLLAAPDMSIQGEDSYAQTLHWFFDQTTGPLPQPAAVSISLWWYKGAMLAWALWLALALLRWLRWAWRAYGAGGAWRGRIARSTEQAPA